MDDCNHRWLSIDGTNDYECDHCGSRKGDAGVIYPPRMSAEQVEAGERECCGTAECEAGYQRCDAAWERTAYPGLEALAAEWERTAGECERLSRVRAGLGDERDLTIAAAVNRRRAHDLRAALSNGDVSGGVGASPNN